MLVNFQSLRNTLNEQYSTSFEDINEMQHRGFILPVEPASEGFYDEEIIINNFERDYQRYVDTQDYFTSYEAVQYIQAEDSSLHSLTPAALEDMARRNIIKSYEVSYNHFLYPPSVIHDIDFIRDAFVRYNDLLDQEEQERMESFESDTVSDDSDTEPQETPQQSSDLPQDEVFFFDEDEPKSKRKKKSHSSQIPYVEPAYVPPVSPISSYETTNTPSSNEDTYKTPQQNPENNREEADVYKGDSYTPQKDNYNHEYKPEPMESSDYTNKPSSDSNNNQTKDYSYENSPESKYREGFSNTYSSDYSKGFSEQEASKEYKKDDYKTEYNEIPVKEPTPLQSNDYINKDQSESHSYASSFNNYQDKTQQEYNQKETQRKAEESRRLEEQRRQEETRERTKRLDEERARQQKKEESKNIFQPKSKSSSENTQSPSNSFEPSSQPVIHESEYESNRGYKSIAGNAPEKQKGVDGVKLNDDGSKTYTFGGTKIHDNSNTNTVTHWGYSDTEQSSIGRGDIEYQKGKIVEEKQSPSYSVSPQYKENVSKVTGSVIASQAAINNVIKNVKETGNNYTVYTKDGSELKFEPDNKQGTVKVSYTEMNSKSSQVVYSESSGSLGNVYDTYASSMGVQKLNLGYDPTKKEQVSDDNKFAYAIGAISSPEIKDNKIVIPDGVTYINEKYQQSLNDNGVTAYQHSGSSEIHKFEQSYKSYEPPKEAYKPEKLESNITYDYQKDQISKVTSSIFASKTAFDAIIHETQNTGKSYSIYTKDGSEFKFEKDSNTGNVSVNHYSKDSSVPTTSFTTKEDDAAKAYSSYVSSMGEKSSVEKQTTELQQKQNDNKILYAVGAVSASSFKESKAVVPEGVKFVNNNIKEDLYKNGIKEIRYAESSKTERLKESYMSEYRVIDLLGKRYTTITSEAKDVTKNHIASEAALNSIIKNVQTTGNSYKFISKDGTEFTFKQGSDKDSFIVLSRTKGSNDFVTLYSSDNQGSIGKMYETYAKSMGVDRLETYGNSPEQIKNDNKIAFAIGAVSKVNVDKNGNAIIPEGVSYIHSSVKSDLINENIKHYNVEGTPELKSTIDSKYNKIEMQGSSNAKTVTDLNKKAEKTVSFNPSPEAKIKNIQSIQSKAKPLTVPEGEMKINIAGLYANAKANKAFTEDSLNQLHSHGFQDISHMKLEETNFNQGLRSSELAKINSITAGTVASKAALKDIIKNVTESGNTFSFKTNDGSTFHFEKKLSTDEVIISMKKRDNDAYSQIMSTKDNNYGSLYKAYAKAMNVDKLEAGGKLSPKEQRIKDNKLIYAIGAVQIGSSAKGTSYNLPNGVSFVNTNLQNVFAQKGFQTIVLQNGNSIQLQQPINSKYKTIPLNISGSANTQNYNGIKHISTRNILLQNAGFGLIPTTPSKNQHPLINKSNYVISATKFKNGTSSYQVVDLSSNGKNLKMVSKGVGVRATHANVNVINGAVFIPQNQNIPANMRKFITKTNNAPQMNMSMLLNKKFQTTSPVNHSVNKTSHKITTTLNRNFVAASVWNRKVAKQGGFNSNQPPIKKNNLPNLLNSYTYQKAMAYSARNGRSKGKQYQYIIKEHVSLFQRIRDRREDKNIDKVDLSMPGSKLDKKQQLKATRRNIRSSLMLRLAMKISAKSYNNYFSTGFQKTLGRRSVISILGTISSARTAKIDLINTQLNLANKLFTEYLGEKQIKALGLSINQNGVLTKNSIKNIRKTVGSNSKALLGFDATKLGNKQIAKILKKGKLNGKDLTDAQKSVLLQSLHIYGLASGDLSVFNIKDIMKQKGVRLSKNYDLTTQKGIKGLLSELHDISLSDRFSSIFKGKGLNGFNTTQLKKLLKDDSLSQEAKALIETTLSAKNLLQNKQQVKAKRKQAVRRIGMLLRYGMNDSTFGHGVRIAIATTEYASVAYKIAKPVVVFVSKQISKVNVKILEAMLGRKWEGLNTEIRMLAKKVNNKVRASISGMASAAKDLSKLLAKKGLNYAKTQISILMAKSPFLRKMEKSTTQVAKAVANNAKKVINTSKTATRFVRNTYNQRRVIVKKVKNKINLRKKDFKLKHPRISKVTNKIKKVSSDIGRGVSRVTRGIQKATKKITNVVSAPFRFYNKLQDWLRKKLAVVALWGLAFIAAISILDIGLTSLDGVYSLVMSQIYKFDETVTEKIEEINLDRAESITNDRLNLCFGLDAALKYYAESFYKQDDCIEAVKNEIPNSEKNKWYNPKTKKTFEPDELGLIYKGVQTGVHYTYYDGDGNEVGLRSNAKDILSLANSWMDDNYWPKGLMKSYVEKLWSYSHTITYNARQNGGSGKYIYACDSAISTSDAESPCADNTFKYYCNSADSQSADLYNAINNGQVPHTLGAYEYSSFIAANSKNYIATQSTPSIYKTTNSLSGLRYQGNFSDSSSGGKYDYRYYNSTNAGGIVRENSYNGCSWHKVKYCYANGTKYEALPKAYTNAIPGCTNQGSFKSSLSGTTYYYCKGHSDCGNHNYNGVNQNCSSTMSNTFEYTDYHNKHQWSSTKPCSNCETRIKSNNICNYTYTIAQCGDGYLQTGLTSEQAKTLFIKSNGCNNVYVYNSGGVYLAYCGGHINKDHCSRTNCTYHNAAFPKKQWFKVVGTRSDGGVNWNYLNGMTSSTYKSTNIHTGKIKMTVYCTGNYPTYEYRCKGHAITTSANIKGPCKHFCPGHQFIYCTGHCDLEVSVVTLFLDGQNTISKLGIPKTVSVNHKNDGKISRLKYDPLSAGGKGISFRDSVPYNEEVANSGAGTLYTSNSILGSIKTKNKLPDSVSDIAKQKMQNVDNLQFAANHTVDTADFIPTFMNGNSYANMNAVINALYFDFWDPNGFKDLNDQGDFQSLDMVFQHLGWNSGLVNLKMYHTTGNYNKFGKYILFEGFYDYKYNSSKNSGTIIEHIDSSTHQKIYAERGPLSRAYQIYTEDWSEEYKIDFAGSYKGTITKEDRENLIYLVKKEYIRRNYPSLTDPTAIENKIASLPDSTPEIIMANKIIDGIGKSYNESMSNIERTVKYATQFRTGVTSYSNLQTGAISYSNTNKISPVLPTVQYLSRIPSTKLMAGKYSGSTLQVDSDGKPKKYSPGDSNIYNIVKDLKIGDIVGIGNETYIVYYNDLVSGSIKDSIQNSSIIFATCAGGGSPRLFSMPYEVLVGAEDSSENYFWYNKA